jgi:RNA polymerase sigma factor (sigma-70 family)
MYYKDSRRSDLTEAEMDLAAKAFRGKLIRLRFSPSFVINNSEDLLGKAREDFARALDRGVEIVDPVGFTVHCAWRHTQNLLRSEERTPTSVSTEKAAEIADAELLPDELVLANDRVRKVEQAISKLNENQRKVVALIFFEDMSWREAAKELGWSASKVQHHHEKAMEHLRRFLAVKSSDELVIDVGMAAWVSCAGASAHGLPAGFEAVLDRASDGASGIWGKGQELARRLATGGGGGDQLGALASSGGGRALGACATVAVACIVGGAAVVGPGIGASGPDHRAEDHRPPISSTKGESHNPQEAAALTVPTHEALPGPTSSTARQTTGSQKHRAETTARSPRAESERVEAQTSGIARASAESEEAPSSTSTASASSERSEPEAVTVTSAPSQPASAQEEASAQKQFSAFK